MSNAWFYYGFPLFISLGFLAGGAWIFTGAVRGRGNQNQGRLASGCGSIVMILVGAGLGGAIVLESPTPWQRQRLFDRAFETPPENIERFVILPGDKNQYKPLTPRAVTIDDPATVRRIAGILRAAQEVSPSHPHSRWTANLEIVTRGGTYSLVVSAPEAGDSNGTLITVRDPGAPRWNLGDVRADGLDEVLDEVVKRAGIQE